MLRNCCGPAPIYFTASASIPALDIGSAKSWCLPSSCPRPHARKQGRLEISDARASRTSELLAAMCTATVQRWVQQELSTWSKLSLRSLHTLYLGDFVAGYAEFITALFESPFLRRLSLDTLDGGDYTPLLRLMTNAFPMLTVLTIRHLEMSDTKETEDVIWEWLCSMPKLKFLKISRVTDRFFGALLRHPQLMSGCIGGGTDMQPVCPVLKDVEFVDNNFQMASRLLDSRRELGVPLRHVFVSTDNATSGELEHYQNLPGLVVSRAHAHMRRDLELQYLYD